jgi:hypothetical protein
MLNQSPAPTPRPASVFAGSAVFGVLAGVAHRWRSAGMSLRSVKKRSRVLLGILGFVYGGGYLWARSNHALVHRVSFVSDAGKMDFFHRVTAGDFGPGILQSRGTQIVVTTSYYVFTPLRWFEAVVWHVVPKQHAI